MRKCCFFMAVVLLLSLCATPLHARAEYGAEIEAMLPALDSLMRSVGYEDAVYDPHDPDFFWYALYLMAVNWNFEHPLASVDEETYDLTLPRKAVQELATALFADYDDLLPVPESMSASAIYDKAYDAYRFPMSDMGDSYTEIESVVHSDDGSVVVLAALKGYDEEEDALQRMWFVLTSNPYADGISDPIYLYSVSDAVFVE